MLKACLVAVALALLGGGMSTASASPVLCSPCLFYSGDFDGVDALSNELNTIVSDSRVYDNAVTGSDSWLVDGIFTNNLIEPGSSFIGGRYEIRIGVSAGNPGTLIAAGDLLSGAGFSLLPNGQDDPLSDYYGAFALCNVPGQLLAANTAYWFSCTPRDSGSGRSFESTTSGSDAFSGFGGHVANAAYWDSDFFAVNFVDSEDPRGCVIFEACTDFSFGVIGTTQQGPIAPVPEPSSWLLLGTGLVGIGRQIRRRFTQ